MFRLITICLLMLAWAGTGAARADVAFSLTLFRESKPAYGTNYGQTWYCALPALSDTNAPISYHRVESPTGIYSVNFGTNTDLEISAFNSAGQLLVALTNGDWKLWLNRETPEEQLYTFTLTTDSITNESLGPVVISTPLNGGLNISTNPPYLWSGPADFDGISVLLRNRTNEMLTATETEWTNAPALDPGTNFFAVTYFRDATTNFTVSTPTNDAYGLLTNWTAPTIALQSTAEAGFLVEGLAPSPLALALDAPGLIWTTGGNAEWFPQTFITHDGTDAARSGEITNTQSTTLRTVIYGTNTIAFWWKVDCEGEADYVEFTDNGIYVTDLTGVVDWQPFTYQLAPGTVHVLEWTYHKNIALTEGADAAFLDRVSVAGQPTIPLGEPLTFTLKICRQETNAPAEFGTNQIQFLAIPGLGGPTNPISYHRVESPNDFCSANFGMTNGGFSAGLKLDFAEFADALTNGSWKIWLNKETPEEQFFTFTFTALSFTSNDLGVVTISAPLPGATNVVVHPSFEWNGLPDWDDLFIEATQERFGTNHQYASAMLSCDETNWLGGPAMSPGTNYFFVRYENAANTNFALSTPFLNWAVGAITFESSTRSGFVVTTAAAVQLLDAQQIGADFQFAFQSELGRSNVIQSCPDLQLGLWQDRTNFPGDGTLKTISLPISSEPMEFFRVLTQ